MELDASKLSPPEIYRLMISAVVPRPIAWISTQSPDGKSNLAPFSFFNAVSSDPPCLMFAVTRKPDGSAKDTERNLELTGECVVNIASESFLDAMNQTSAPYDYGVSEFEKAGVATAPSRVVRAPRVRDAVVSMECKLYKTLQIGEPQVGGSLLVVVRIVHLHVVDGALKDGMVDFGKLNPLSRLGGQDYGVKIQALEKKRPTRA
jgi:flavin reductase (DIM6/NTAB) family NADH-FMN oxidoreductase RutF